MCLLRHYLEQGLSKTAIAERTGISRRTIHHSLATGELDRNPDAAIQWLSDNSSIYTALDTLLTAERLHLVPISPRRQRVPGRLGPRAAVNGTVSA